MARINYGRSPEGQGPYPHEGQGVHHHYHYYGEAAGRRYARSASPGDAGPIGPADLHRHPGADSLIKGLLIGAGVAYLLTNERAQRALLKTGVQLWTAAQNSVEEWKERLRDAEAEVAAATAAAPDEKGTPPG